MRIGNMKLGLIVEIQLHLIISKSLIILKLRYRKAENGIRFILSDVILETYIYALKKIYKISFLIFHYLRNQTLILTTEVSYEELEGRS